MSAMLLCQRYCHIRNDDRSADNGAEARFNEPKFAPGKAQVGMT